MQRNRKTNNENNYIKNARKRIIDTDDRITAIDYWVYTDDIILIIFTI